MAPLEEGVVDGWVGEPAVQCSIGPIDADAIDGGAYGPGSELWTTSLPGPVQLDETRLLAAFNACITSGADSCPSP
jgi:hypothetical protein